MKRLGRRGLLTAGLVLALAQGCRPAAEPAPGITVFAAASLREALSAVARDLEANAGLRPAFNFAGSQELRTQLEHGAPADVFVSADRRHMAAVVAAGLAAEPRLLACNDLVVVTPRDGSLRAFADLARAERIVLGAPEVPVGAYAAKVLERAAATLGAGFRSDVERRVVSRELNVRQVLQKVALAEADAGIVYRTDVGAARERVAVIEIPPEFNVIAEIVVAPLRGARNPQGAERFVEAALGIVGRERLRAAGFRDCAPGEPR
jgi:molybdate transport system substrate-binding protein